MADDFTFRFSSEAFDKETGLVYYGYRYYSPELGRWLSRDPIGEAGGLNLYGFIGNDPVNYVDMWGLYSWFDGLIDDAANFAAGFGDHVSGGLTQMIREDYSVEGVNYNSTAYSAGVYTGYAHDAAMIVATGKVSAQAFASNPSGFLAAAGGLYAADMAAREAIDKYADPCNRKRYKTYLNAGERGAGNVGALAVGSKLPKELIAFKRLLRWRAKGISLGSGATKSTVRANYRSGNAARDFIASREGTDLIEQTFHVSGGSRRVDVLVDSDELLAIESKVGRTSLGKSRGLLKQSRIRQELARDIKLLRSGQVDNVRWEFFKSARTGLGGPTAPLRSKLEKFGIEIIEHTRSF